MKKAQKPEWLRIKSYPAKENAFVEGILKKFSLNTVCCEAACPNRGECYGRKTATFMILGKTCTRGCTFCNVSKGMPEPVDKDEPYHVAQAVKALNLRHTVITSVTRDDLTDGGAEQFARVIEAIRKETPDVTIEVLIPDFKGDIEALSKVAAAHPDIINHNVETVPSLYAEVRPQADYLRSLAVLKAVKDIDETIYTKSGIMVGLGEKPDEVSAVFSDLRNVHCDFLTIGQYLSPSRQHHPVIEYIHPDMFLSYKNKAYEKGFLYVASGPLVRSSYMAEQAIKDRT